MPLTPSDQTVRVGRCPACFGDCADFFRHAPRSFRGGAYEVWGGYIASALCGGVLVFATATAALAYNAHTSSTDFMLNALLSFIAIETIALVAGVAFQVIRMGCRRRKSDAEALADGCKACTVFCNFAAIAIIVFFVLSLGWYLFAFALFPPSDLSRVRINAWRLLYYLALAGDLCYFLAVRHFVKYVERGF